MFDPQVDRVSENHVAHLLRFCEDNPTPRTLGVWCLVRQLGLVSGRKPFSDSEPSDDVAKSANEHVRDASLELLGLPSPADHDDHERYCIDRYASEFLKKVTWLPTGIDTEAATLVVFEEAEASCREANERLRRGPEPWWFERVRSNIRAYLGPLNSDVLDSIVERMRHGPGSSVGVSGDGLTVSDKYRKPVTCTEALLPYAEALMGPSWFPNATMQVVEGSKYGTVPKKATIERGIATEPTLNMYCQLGLGSHVVSRLRRFGVDLHSQAWNQFLAEVAQDWRLATLDLSSASDCVAYEAVRSLLPPEWFHLFALFRSPKMQIKGQWRSLEKWSTMGNGYTFPLETLIFKAVVSAMVPRDEWLFTAVYGDDMIVPQKHAAAVIDALEYLGFHVNKEKSFLAGNFFESCGADFLRGRQCRPSHAPNEPGPIPKSVQTANGFRLWLHSVFGKCPSHFKPLWDDLVKHAPRTWRDTCVPPSWGDVGIIRDKPLAEWLVADPEGDGHGWEGHLAKSVVFVPTDTSHADYQDFFVLLAGLRRIGNYNTGGTLNGVSIRGLEPRKGLFGRPISRLAFAPSWTPGFEWV